MSYSIDRKLGIGFDEAVQNVRDALKNEGFGVLTEINVNQVLKEKIGVEFRKYKILGACNPNFAYKALQHENRIGTMLPCNVIVQETATGETDVSAVDPVASMQAVDNPGLTDVAREVKEKLTRVIASL